MQTKLTFFFSKCHVLLLGIEPGTPSFLQCILPLYHVSTVFELSKAAYIYISIHAYRDKIMKIV